MSDRFEFKEHRSPKLKSPEWIAYDDKGAAFILAPFGMRKDVDMAAVISSVNSAPAAERLVAAAVDCAKRMEKLRELLKVSGAPNAQWNILDTKEIRAAIADYEKARGTE